MKIGIMDIGTNSVRLFIPDPESLADSRKYMRITRIGEGVDRNRILLDEAMDRTIDGLRQLKAIGEAHGVERFLALATSAVRDASNREVFIDRVRDALGIRVEVITGKQEAHLGYVGAIGGMADSSRDYLIIDIGGGSTELIEVSRGDMVKSHSFDIGVVRLTELFELSDPPTPDQFEAMRRHVRSEIGSFLSASQGALLGIGGTVTTLAAVHLEMAEYDRQVIHSSRITREAVDEIFGRLAAMDNDERRYVVGLDEKRADVILAGVVILQQIMDLTGQSDLVVSDFDNLEGYYFEEID